MDAAFPALPLPVAPPLQHGSAWPAPGRSRDVAPDLRSPQTLHPALWLGHQLGRTGNDAVSSGFAALDRELPGQGWPRRCLSELLLATVGIGELRFLAPPLLQTQGQGRRVMLFDPPARLCAQALLHLGFAVDELLIVTTRARVVPGSDSLWAL
ncbi:MAG: hypothetical protein M3Z16_08350, partial [Pseudomonadota bacterium]|nr:hypothetical protein [Pseudomonadota bacterium]